MAKLIITEGGSDKVYEIIDDRFTIGSGPEADLQLRSSGVAPLHVTVQKTKAGFKLIDMETKTGTTVNGKTVNSHMLANGDTLQLDDVKITYIGKGPGRAAAATKKAAPKLESSKYYRHAEPKKTSTAQLLTIAFGGLGLLVLVVWLIFSSSDPADLDMVKAELADGVRMSADGAVNDEGKARIQELLKKYRNQSELSSEEKKLYVELKKNWANVETTLERIDDLKLSGYAYTELHNLTLKQPEAFADQEALAKAWLEKYDYLNTDKEDHVRRILDTIELRKNASPDDKEMLRVKAVILAAIQNRDLHPGQKALLEMDPKVRMGQPEFVDDMDRMLRMKSRQWLGVRKNNVREFLRDDKYDPIKARQIAIDEIFTKLIYSTIEAYLDSPDKYSQQNNQEAEYKTQELLRELLKEMKPGY